MGAKGQGSSHDEHWKRPDASAMAAQSVPSPDRPRNRPASAPRVVGARSVTAGKANVNATLPASARNPAAASGGSRDLRGPERFFYDRSTYTGAHRHGGPESVNKGSGTAHDQSWKRPD